MGRRAARTGCRNFFGAIFGGRLPADALAAGAADAAAGADEAAGAALADVITRMLAVAVAVGFAVAGAVAVAVAAAPAAALVSVGAADSSFLPQPTRSVMEAATVSASVEIFMAHTSTRTRPPR